MKNELEEHKVRHDIITELKSDDETEIEHFVNLHANKNAYEKRLTQSEDVRKWIDDPTQISLIQSNLNAVVNTLKLIKEPWSLIDIGCYAGYVYDFLSSKFSTDAFVYTGCDIRDTAINASKELHTRSTNVTFFTQDLFKLKQDLGPKGFDFSFSARVLVHLPNFTEAVSNLVYCATKATFLIMPIADVGTTQFRHKVSLEDGSVMPYLYRYVSRKMLDQTSATIGVPYRILPDSQAYATIVFVSEKLPRPFLAKMRRKSFQSFFHLKPRTIDFKSKP